MAMAINQTRQHSRTAEVYHLHTFRRTASDTIELSNRTDAPLLNEHALILKISAALNIKQPSDFKKRRLRLRLDVATARTHAHQERW